MLFPSDDLKKMLDSIIRLSRIHICLYENEKCVFNDPVDDPYNLGLLKQAQEKAFPLIITDEDGASFSCITWENKGAIIGPCAFSQMDVVSTHHFFIRHGSPKVPREFVSVLSYERFLALIEFMAKLLTGITYSDEELTRANGFDDIDEKKEEAERIKQQIRNEDEERAHHTYHEEKVLLDAIRNGNAEEAIRHSMALDRNLGMMSSNEKEQWKRSAIVAITLCSRAAISTGVKPSEVYSASDHYLQKLDAVKNTQEIISIRNRGLTELCRLVNKKRISVSHSSYVEQCRDYVDRHYREKIYLEDIADSLSISPAYLSRTFSKETGKRLQDYIVEVRIERASNLLKYTDRSMAEIAEYVNFPSASYFGRVFKENMGMTPAKYRNEFKPKEFMEKGTNDV